MEILGLSGFARVGKDEVANILVSEYGFTRVAFADKLRDFLYALNPIVSFEGWVVKGTPVTPAKETYVTVQNVIDRFGWGGYKETEYGDEIRRLLQRLGTEAGRQTMWDSIWIDAAFANLDTDKIVVTDARFYNELDAIRERGGKIWRVERPGVGPLNDHASENEATNYPNFAATIMNNGTLDDLKLKVARIYGE
jgi:hypothetical protein